MAQQTENHQHEQTELEDEIQSCTPPSQRKSRMIPSWSVVSKRNWCGCDQFAEEKQQKLEERAVENQAEDEVESHVDGATELQDQRTRSRWGRGVT